MVVLLTVNKSIIIKIILIIIIASIFITTIYSFHRDTTAVFADDQMLGIIQEIFSTRDKAILTQDTNSIEKLYNRGIVLGNWAYEHQIKKLKYLHMWANKQGIKFVDIFSKIKINRINRKSNSFSATLAVTTQYKYAYENEPDIVNSFKLGTYHSLQATINNDNWAITKEWYTDPFADSLSLNDIKSMEVRNYILSNKSQTPSAMNTRRISVVAYADCYCGGNDTDDHDFIYNKQYRNYNYMGGDCANFVSQALFEGGKFKKTYTWNYNNKGGSKAWLNANALKSYMLNSGRASLIAHGSYLSVFKTANQLKSGDIIAYEKKGKVVHVSIVTGTDSKGYALINCHNADRYHVPWDLGWSDKGIQFWLIKVHY